MIYICWQPTYDIAVTLGAYLSEEENIWEKFVIVLFLAVIKFCICFVGIVSRIVVYESSVNGVCVMPSLIKLGPKLKLKSNCKISSYGCLFGCKKKTPVHKEKHKV